MAQDTASTSGNETVGVLRFDNPVDGGTAAKSERLTLYGHPLQLFQLTLAAGVTTLKDYPDDGDGLVVASDSTHVTLATGVLGGTNWDITGLVVAIVLGTGIGQVRRIIAYNTGTKQATVNRAWGTNPAAGATYRLGIETWGYSEFHIKAEFEKAASASPTAQLIAALYDFGCDPPTTGVDQGKIGLLGPLRTFRRYNDLALDIENQDFSDDILQSTYRHGQSRTVPTRGATFAKIRLHGAPAASGKIALYAGVS